MQPNLNTLRAASFCVLHGLNIFVLVMLPSKQLFAASCESVARIVSLEGSIEYKTANTEHWNPAVLEQDFCSGDALRSGRDSRAALRMINDTLLRLDHSTAIVFTSVAQKERSFLDLLKGALHFISRVPRSLEVNTPYLNAAIEGTEFVIQVKEDSAEVTVYEGKVVASNASGSVDLISNQTGAAASGQAPVRIVVTHPRDAVAWTLYYPPLPVQRDKADEIAHKVIDAIVKNDIDRAITLAQQAIAENTQSAAAFMAQSYVDQARFDIPAALEHSRTAAELAPRDAITQARLAEVLLMTGDTKAAKVAATNAVQLDPSLAHTQTVLGFSSLRAVNLDDAESAFNQAIRLDSAAPLPRLGIGLVKIRRGDLKAGREEIETAALLDPNNALLRSYMGKAYYEEKRGTLASGQFSIAKDLDPNDPTAWFYDSILLQSQNRPVEALQAQQKAIELNDNRGVYRSRQLLDKDNAARNVALGRIYNDLNFEQLARLQATNALAQDLGNHSAHRLLADSYAGITNLDAARQSELLQSKLTQPLNLDPLQPQLSNANLGLLDGNGPGDLSYNEYNPLFTRNGMALQIDAAAAEQGTWSEDVIVAGLFNKFAFSLGQFHTETDGFRANADYEQDIVNAFTQFAFSENTSFQFEISQNEEFKGDVIQRMIPSLLNDPNLKINSETTDYRLGLNHTLSPRFQLLFSTSYKTKKDERKTQTPQQSEVSRSRETDIGLWDFQLNYLRDKYGYTVGASYNKDKQDATTFLNATPLIDRKETEEQARIYAYYFFQPTEPAKFTLGLTAAQDNSDSFDEEETRLFPKLGLIWHFKDQSELRLAAYRSISSSTNSSVYQTLEPTHISGFNQVYDEFRQSTAWNYGLAFIQDISPQLSAGLQVIQRDGKTPFKLTDLTSTPFASVIKDIEFTETQASGWLYWTPLTTWGISLEYHYNDLENVDNFDIAGFVGIAPDGVLSLETHTVPIALNYYHPSGWSGHIASTYYKQKGQFLSGLFGSTPQSAEDDFWLTDLSLSYRLPKNYGVLSIGAKNIFDKKFNFEDRNSYDSQEIDSASPSSLSSERLFFGQISINFR